MTAKANLAANIRKLRIAAQWSQEELADRTGIHRTYISGLERGARNPSIGVLEKIADALNVAPYKLLEPVCE